MTLRDLFITIILVLLGRLHADEGEFSRSIDVTSIVGFPVTSGHILASVPETQEAPIHSVKYYVPAVNPEGSAPIILTESISGIAFFIRSEFPQGISADFAQNILPNLLCETFSSSTSAGMARVSKIAETRDSLLSMRDTLSTEEYEFLLELIKVPKVAVTNERWVMKYTTWNMDGSIGIRIFCGTMNPFNIQIRTDVLLAQTKVGFLLASPRGQSEISLMMARSKEADILFQHMQKK